MNEHYENYDMDEMEIDLIDFLFYLLRRWKSLVAMILLGAVLGSAFYVVKTTKAANTVTGDYQPDADTEANMKLAAQYRKLYDQQMDYNEHSIVMQMDPNQVYEGTLTYYLAAGEQTERLAQLFTDIVNDPTVLEELKEAAGLDCEDQYVKELVSSMMSQKNVDESSVVSGNLDNNVVNQMQVVVPTDDILNTMITYQVDYLNQGTCEKMVAVLQDAVASAVQKYTNTYGEYEFDQLQNVVAVTVDEKRLEKQKSSAVLMDNYLTKLTTLEGAFDDTELMYYQEKYLVSERADVERVQEIQNGIAAKDLVKWLIIGIVVLIILWGAYYFMKYLIDPSIKTLGEIRKMNFPIIGYIEKDNKKPVFIERMEKRKNGCCDTIEYIIASIRALQKKKILLCFDSDSVISASIRDALKYETTNMKINNWIQNDIEALEEAKSADGIVLEIRLKKTSMKQLKKELDICHTQNINILGVICVQE